MNFKQQIYQQCIKIVDERIALAQKLILEAQKASNQESKSSMGDKYETSREMMALEMRKAGEQLYESSKLKQVVSGHNADTIHTKIAIGSLISTSIGDFYLMVSLGQVKLNNKVVFILSAVSPLGKILLNKCVGDEFIFNSKKVEIKSIA